MKKFEVGFILYVLGKLSEFEGLGQQARERIKANETELMPFFVAGVIAGDEGCVVDGFNERAMEEAMPYYIAYISSKEIERKTIEFANNENQDIAILVFMAGANMTQTYEEAYLKWKAIN